MITPIFHFPQCFSGMQASSATRGRFHRDRQPPTQQPVGLEGLKKEES